MKITKLILISILFQSLFALSGKELAKLARVSKKPSIIVDNSIINISFKNLISKIKSFLAQDDIDKAWQFILNWDKNND